MRMRRLGANGPELSVIGLGAWEAGGDAWGANPADQEVVRAFHAGFDAGIKWVDTAEVYGKGVSERLVGAALVGRREDLIVATKVGPSPEGTGFRPEQVRAACDASLARLGIDVIDVYQLHWPDETGRPRRGDVGRHGGAGHGGEGPLRSGSRTSTRTCSSAACRSIMWCPCSRSSRCWRWRTAT